MKMGNGPGDADRVTLLGKTLAACSWSFREVGNASVAGGQRQGERVADDMAGLRGEGESAMIILLPLQHQLPQHHKGFAGAGGSSHQAGEPPAPRGRPGGSADEL
jgi:hypothetical protein